VIEQRIIELELFVTAARNISQLDL